MASKAPNPYTAPPEDPVLACVEVEVDHIEKTEDGTFRLYFNARPLTQDQRRVLQELFPAQIEEAYRLLSIEALLARVRR